MAAPRPSRAVSSFICQSCLRRNPARGQQRSFASTPSTRADNDAPSADKTSPAPAATYRPGGLLGGLANSMHRQSSSARVRPGGFRSSISAALDGRADAGSLLSGRNFDNGDGLAPHRLHVYSTKHNTHLTLVQAPRPASETTGNLSGTKGGTQEANKMVDVLMSMSSGNLGFKKAARNSFDAAYQLTTYFITQIRERGMLRDIEKVEILFRGFGEGREAVQKVLLAPEGRIIRDKVSAVLDSTRLKHGGTRGKKPRRLG